MQFSKPTELPSLSERLKLTYDEMKARSRIDDKRCGSRVDTHSDHKIEMHSGEAPHVPTAKGSVQEEKEG